jgi:hypothetical protein
MAREHVPETYGPPDNEDPDEVTTDIRWSSPTGTVSIPRVYVYSTGVYFPVIYRTVDPPPSLPENTPDERRAAAEASFARLSRWHLRIERLRLNGTHVVAPTAKSHKQGFSTWAWSDYRTHQAGRPDNAMRFRLDWPDLPEADATVPYPPPGSPTGPVRGAPTYWRDENGAGHIVLRSSVVDPTVTA